MPMIEIDNDELVGRARREIGRISGTRRDAHDMQYAELMRVIGWIGALMTEKLISDHVFLKLIEEAKTNAADVLGVDLNEPLVTLEGINRKHPTPC